VSVTPDGRRAVSGSDDKTLRVWDLESGQCLRTLTGHTAGVTSVSVTPDGRRAVSGSRDKTLRVWDLESGQCLRTLQGHSDDVNSVSVTPDGRRAVSGSRDKTLRVWDLESGECLAVFQSSGGGIKSLAVHSQLLVLGTHTGLMEFLEMRGSLTARAASWLTLARVWRFSAPNQNHAHRDERWTARCPHCGTVVEGGAEILLAIARWQCGAGFVGLEPGSSAGLPAAAWEDPHLLSACPHCHSELRFTPFVAWCQPS
jgi:hypothetical protein